MGRKSKSLEKLVEDCANEVLRELSIEEKELPKNKKGIKIQMEVNSADADVIRESLKEAGHYRLAEDFETRRELGIMHEIMDNGGVANCLEVWSKGDYYGDNSNKDTRKPLHKLEHRVLAK